MSQTSHFCGMCDIFVSGDLSQCDILDGVLLRGFFQGNAASGAACGACRLPVLRLRGAVNTASALVRLEAVLTVPLRSGRTERESSRGAKGKGMRGSPRTRVGRLLWDMRGATIIVGVWYISSDGLARGGVTGRGTGGPSTSWCGQHNLRAWSLGGCVGRTTSLRTNGKGGGWKGEAWGDVGSCHGSGSRAGSLQERRRVGGRYVGLRASPIIGLK